MKSFLFFPIMFIGVLFPLNRDSIEANLLHTSLQDQESDQSDQNDEKAAQDSEAKEPDERVALANKIRDAYWEKIDKKGSKRKAEPRLFPAHEKMTLEWVNKLDLSDFGILSIDETDVRSEEDTKRANELDRIYNKKSQEVATQIGLARKLAKKISKAHWEGLEKTGIKKANCPEYAAEYDQSVEGWFLDRTIEDLRIFEKGKPSESERERGDKITSELLKKIEEVKKKYEGNLR